MNFNRTCLVSAVCAGLLLASCNEAPKSGAGQHPVVHAEEVVAAPAGADRAYTFIARPYKVSDLSFRVGGPVIRFSAQSGQFFRKGEVIAAIDDRDFIIRVERAKAVYAQAKSEFERIDKLFRKDNISGSVHEKAKAELAQAEAACRTAVNELADTRLTAPHDGYVQQVYIQQHQDVRPSSPVISFIDLSKVKAETYISEEMVAALHPQGKDACTIRFNREPDRIYRPEQVFVTQSASRNNVSFLLTALIDNRDGQLFGGMSGEISVHPDAKTERTVPAVRQSALMHDEDSGSYVWRIDPQGCVRRTAVHTGRFVRNDLVEITSGLQVGDRVVTGGGHFLSDGQQVTAN